AAFFFQQLISGVSYCHTMEICHRDLKLENTLLDRSFTTSKICDFWLFQGLFLFYSWLARVTFNIELVLLIYFIMQSGLLHSQPKSTVGTPAYIAPEVLSRKEYDGKEHTLLRSGRSKLQEDHWERIWKCPILHTRLYAISADCKNLLSRIFVANPSKRITIPEIKKHPWFLKNLPKELMDSQRAKYEEASEQLQQSVESMKMIQEAKIPGEVSKPEGKDPAGTTEKDDTEEDLESEIDSSNDFAVYV
ncbi:hypothetical protein HAX54_010835, partial [Datura stramonium]|nr:hypothetical protein [Datura stramonium]